MLVVLCSTIRVAFAPLEDDGIVSWSTAAITGVLVPELETREREVDSSSAQDWIGTDTYFKDDSLAGVMRDAAISVVSLGWTIVDVAMTHKQLATLYPSAHNSPLEPNLENLALADEVLATILALLY